MAVTSLKKTKDGRDRFSNYAKRNDARKTKAN
jgi:hypothetical protein